MTVLTQTFATGTGSVTTGSMAADGEPADLVVGTWDYATIASPVVAGKVAEFSGGATQQLRFNNQATTKLASRTIMRFGSVAPSTTLRLIYARTAVGTEDRLLGLGITTQGRIVALNKDSVISATNVAGAAVTAGPDWVFDCLFEANNTAGRIQYDIYNGLSQTPHFSFDSGAITLPETGIIDQHRIGQLNSGTWAGPHHVLQAEFDNDPAATLFGPLVVAGPLVETQAEGKALLEITGGTPPFTIAQTAGTTTAATELDDGSVSGTGQWLVTQSTTEALTYEVTDDASVVSDPYVVPKVSSGNTQQLRPSAAPPGSTWS